VLNSLEQAPKKSDGTLTHFYMHFRQNVDLFVV
jgi:hypothetical protein